MSIKNKIRPKSGFSYIFHIGLNALLPLLVFVLVRIGFAEIGLALILLAKWRMFAVRPRYWPANIRANGVDLIVGISILIFMTHTTTASWQFVWAIIYTLWLVVLKPSSNTVYVIAQAFVGQFMGLMALFLWLSGAPLYQLIIGTWVICYLSARHFFAVYEEPFTSLYSHSWGYFSASLIWVLGHWLLFYGVFAQPTVILSLIGFTLGSLYYLDDADKLSKVLKRQILLIMVAVLMVILVFSNWRSQIV